MRFLILLALLLAGRAFATNASTVGTFGLLAEDEAVTGQVTCVYDVLAISLGGTLSSGDTVTLQAEDGSGTPETFVAAGADTSWTDSDMPVADVHVCSGRKARKYRLQLTDADDSSSVQADLWVLPRASRIND